MLQRTVFFVVGMAAALAQAGGPLPSVFRVEKASGSAASHGAVGIWGVAPAGGRVLVEIECETFERDGRERLHADATLRLTVRNADGAVQTRVVRPSDTTDLDRGQRKARVAAVVSGSGVSYLQIEVQVDSRHCAAGRYDTELVASLSTT